MFLRLIIGCILLAPSVLSGAGPVEVRRAVPVERTDEARAGINDMARFIAGIQPPAGSPLAGLAAMPEWNAYAATMNRRWLAFDTARLLPIREWRVTALDGIHPETLFYPFSGPDFIYAETFFPSASRYILCGLEPVGDLPSMEKLVPLAKSLGWLEYSLKTIIEAGYFVTKDMRTDLKLSPLQGTLPLLCVMLARSGDSIISVTHDVSHAEIQFVHGSNGQHATLDYYCVNLRDDGLGKGGAPFVSFIKQMQPGAAYIKAASYLMHGSDFSTIRDLLLSQCPVIVQDDSGIPLRYFDRTHWNMRLYGAYAPPLDIFKQYYQADMADLYRKNTAIPLSFGAGYNWNPRNANLVVYVRK